jgi:erythromycin esterase-like protein
VSEHSVSRRAVLNAGVAALASVAAGRFTSSAVAQSADLGSGRGDQDLVARLDQSAEPLPEISDPNFAKVIDRFRAAKVVLLGESTHGTDEFYRARAAITERLISEHGFNIVAVEADWPDAARIDAYIRGRQDLPSAPTPFQRFPVWMWRNRAVYDFSERLRDLNRAIADESRKVGFYGIDLYSLASSMDAVADYAKRHDPQALDEVHDRYRCLAPFEDDPETYGARAQRPGFETCADEAQSVIAGLLDEPLHQMEPRNLPLFHAVQNARVVAGAEAYYRAMYEGSAESWNVRDTHMFETLKAVFEARGPNSKAVVWAHNSHIGDAAATQMGKQGEINIGHLCRREYGDSAVLLGFGTDHGTVTAATDWGGPAETKTVLPSIPESWGAQMREVKSDRFFLDLRNAEDRVKKLLRPERLERFIGVIYRPETERFSHYASASLAAHFDAYIWIETTKAVEQLSEAEIKSLPPAHPFAS